MYVVRLLRNSFKYLRIYGVRSTYRKSKNVIKRWFGRGTLLVPISKDRYHEWIKHSERSFSYGFTPKSTPLISILMPVYNVKEEYLREAISSIVKQSYPNWEVCMVDDASSVPYIKPLLKELAASDERIKIAFSEENQHISLTTNKAFDISTGEYLLLMDNDDVLSPDALLSIVKKLEEFPDADLIYFDEDKLDIQGDRVEPYFKPSPSPEMLLEMMYPTHALFSRGVFERAGKLRKGYEGSQDYDLVLRVFDITDKIHHIPNILYHWRKVPGSTAESSTYKPYVIDTAKKALKEALIRKGLSGRILGDQYPFKCDIEIENLPSIEIIIPTKDKLEYLKRAVDSIIAKSSYPNYSITIVNNNSVEKETLDYFDNIQKQNIRVLPYPGSFNYSAINNFAVEKSQSEYIIFLNNDTQVLSEKWIEELLIWSQIDKIGAVGCKLLYPDRRVQHAGVIMGLGPDLLDANRPVAGHAFLFDDEGEQRQFNQLNHVQNVAAVTAACLMIKRSLFLSVGGFDEENLAVAYNDVDLCLRLYEDGFRNIYTPYAKLIHYESITRDKVAAEAETKYMYKKWGKYIDRDPYYNPNFGKKSIYSYLLPDDIERTYM